MGARVVIIDYSVTEDGKVAAGGGWAWGRGRGSLETELIEQESTEGGEIGRSRQKCWAERGSGQRPWPTPGNRQPAAGWHLPSSSKCGHKPAEAQVEHFRRKCGSDGPAEGVMGTKLLQVESPRAGRLPSRSGYPQVRRPCSTSGSAATHLPHGLPVPRFVLRWRYLITAAEDGDACAILGVGPGMGDARSGFCGLHGWPIPRSAVGGHHTCLGAPWQKGVCDGKDRYRRAARW